MFTMLIKNYKPSENKAVLFFSASSTGDFQQLYDFGIRETLVSYFYLRKNLSYYERLLPIFKKEGGIFMTDSGAFSFMGKYDESDPEFDKYRTEEFWLPYLNEYIGWIKAHRGYIFSVANLDLDMLVGEDVVNKWNRDYFEPLEKSGLQVVYVAHPTDKRNSMDRLRQYCKRYSYVGANQSEKANALKIFHLVKQYKCRLHGFAWTELNLLKRHPFFSADSVTWLGGVRFGTTYDYDGKNFRTLDYKHKYLRKARRLKYEQGGVDFEKVTTTEERKNINRMNLLGWMGFRKEYLKAANLKLHNKKVSYYIR